MAIPCNTRQYHASLISADGAYLRPVGSIRAFLQYLQEVCWLHPINCVVLLVSLQLVGEDAQLLEDHRQLPHGARWQWSHLLRLEEGQFVWRSEWKFFSQHPKWAISENLFVLQKTFVTNKLC